MQEEILFPLRCIEEQDTNELCTWLNEVHKFFDALQHITDADRATSLLLRIQESDWFADLVIVSVATQRGEAIVSRHSLVADERKLF